MAKKPFEIQDSTLRMGGVNLQAGTNGVVIPGVTQAANYRVEEVEETDVDQTLVFVGQPLTIIDAVTYNDYVANGTSTGRATYTLEYEDGGASIDEIEVVTSGSYTAAEATTNANTDIWVTDYPGDPFAAFDTNVWAQVPFRPKMRADAVENIGGGGELPTITLPGEVGTTYKGLQVSYGMVHSNSSNTELNVNKIVIHKPAVTTTEIDPTSSQDYFRVSGLGSSDLLAMFVIYGDVNGPKSLSTLQAFAEAAIDNVILDNAVEGQYQSVADMKAAFYDNYPSLALAANGLDLDFEFYNSYVNALTGVTTTREGTDATFDISVTTPGSAYVPVVVATAGANYRVGHKIKVLGTDLEGLTPDNDLIITVSSVDAGGAITGISTAGDSNVNATMMLYTRSGSNYQVGSGGLVAGVGKNGDGTIYANINSGGSGYVLGDVLTLLGSDLQLGTTPANDITLIINSVDGNGTFGNWTATGTIPNLWPSNYIGDGGNDQYDTANYINSNLAVAIDYNNGTTVADSAAAFGAGSSYTVVYDTGIFGLLVTGNSATFIETAGNSGADGDSTTEAGNIYGPNTGGQVFDNAVTHINIVGGGPEGQEGIKFADGTRLTSAEGVGRVKLESVGARRIEEVHGYKSVAVTGRETTTVTFTASRTELNSQWFWLNNNATTVDDIINQYPSYGIDSILDMEFSVDNTTWYPYNGSATGDGNTNESAFSVFPTIVSYNQGDTLYFRYTHGAQPVVWWSSADLPEGSSDFRGAVIDYHAYTGDGTIVGTIHIVNDDGEENITHTEVSSGGTDAENNDLWFVQNEGTISYRRIDKQAKTLKIQWTAKVFYGSELYD